jgi:hypothetical protein
MRVPVQAELVLPKRIKQWTFYRRDEDRIRAPSKPASSPICERLDPRSSPRRPLCHGYDERWPAVSISYACDRIFQSMWRV